MVVSTIYVVAEGLSRKRDVFDILALSIFMISKEQRRFGGGKREGRGGTGRERERRERERGGEREGGGGRERGMEGERQSERGEIDR